MVVFKRVVACTDFSETGNRAVEKAFELAEGAEQLILLHAIEPPPVPNPLYSHYAPDPTWSPEVIERVRTTVRQSLEALLPKQEPTPGKGPEIRLDMPIGHAVDEVLRIAEHTKADLIVIGTHGRTGLRRFLLGSVAERVVRTASCPVLVVH